MSKIDYEHRNRLDSVKPTSDRRPITIKEPDAKPTVKQVYLLCHLLCEAESIDFPETRGEMASLITKLKADARRG